MTDLILVLATCASTGIAFAFAFAVKAMRQGRYIAHQDRTARAAHEREVAKSQELADWLEEVRELIPAIADAQRRYGFPLGPRVGVMVAEIAPDAGSRALLQLVPGFQRLSDGERATETFFAPPAAEFTGWTPPRSPAEPPPRRTRRRARVPALASAPERPEVDATDA